MTQGCPVSFRHLWVVRTITVLSLVKEGSKLPPGWDGPPRLGSCFTLLPVSLKREEMFQQQGFRLEMKGTLQALE